MGLAGISRSVERFEQVREVRFRHAAALVLHRDDGVARLFAQRNLHVATAVHGAVPQHVLERAAQGVRVGRNGHIGVGLKLDIDGSVRVFVANVVDHAGYELDEVHGLCCLAGLCIQLREGKQLADDLVEALRLGIDPGQLRHLARLAAGQLERDLEASQRRAKLVRHVTRKLRLPLPGELELARHAVEVLRQLADLVATMFDAGIDPGIQVATGNRDGRFTNFKNRPRQGACQPVRDTAADQESNDHEAQAPALGQPSSDRALRRQDDQGIDLSRGPDELGKRTRRAEGISLARPRRVQAGRPSHTPHRKFHRRRQPAVEQFATLLVDNVDDRFGGERQRLQPVHQSFPPAFAHGIARVDHRLADLEALQRRPRALGVQEPERCRRDDRQHDDQPERQEDA